MRIGKEQLLKQIEQCPGIDVVSIAKATNCDMGDLIAELAELVTTGQVRLVNVDSPHHRRQVIGCLTNSALPSFKAAKEAAIGIMG